MGKTASLANIGTIADSSLGFRNRIINGAMVIDQRNAGASVTSGYVVDRWFTQLSQASKFTFQQNAGNLTGTNLPVGFTKYLGATVSSAYSIGSSDYFIVEHRIEGNNFADMAWGTANAQAVTLSFWVRSSLTGTFGGSLRNGSYNRSYPFTYTISSANTWEQKTVTIAGDTSGTWATDNSVGLDLIFSLGSGSSVSGTAGAWAGASYLGATGATSVVGTNGATFYITGVQLEKGSTATSFDYRPYSTELQLAQRYYVQFNRLAAANTAIGNGIQTTTTSGGAMIPVPVPMRTTPTASGTLSTSDTFAYITTATITEIYYTQCTPVLVNFTTSAVGAQGRPVLAMVSSTTTFGFSAEL